MPDYNAICNKFPHGHVCKHLRGYCEYDGDVEARCELYSTSTLTHSCFGPCDDYMEEQTRERTAPYKNVKTGDIVYVVGVGRIMKCKIEGQYSNEFGSGYYVSFNCDKLCDGCPFESYTYYERGATVCNSRNGRSSISSLALGRGVYLTHEEADKEFLQ